VQTAGCLRFGVELPDDQGTAAVGLHHLDLEELACREAVGPERWYAEQRSSAAAVIARGVTEGPLRPYGGNGQRVLIDGYCRPPRSPEPR
jgi:hypothetical protein